MLALKKIGFRFIYDISNELAEDDSVKGRVFKQIIFLLN
jgi:hypothetical protein